LPSRAAGPGCRGGPAGVGLQAAVDGVADPPLEGPEGFFGGLALGELAAGDLNGSGRLGLLQDMSCLSCDYLFGDATGDQLAEHGMQPAGDLGPAPAQVTVALGPHLEHRRVVLGRHLPRSR
jgi:hypothetical protein